MDELIDDSLFLVRMIVGLAVAEYCDAQAEKAAAEARRCQDRQERYEKAASTVWRRLSRGRSRLEKIATDPAGH